MAQGVLCQDAAEAAGQIGRADALDQLIEANAPVISAALQLAAQTLALFHAKRLDVSIRQALERDALPTVPRFNGIA